MSDLSRLLMNLGLSYVLMDKDQFSEKIAGFLKERMHNEQDADKLVALLFDQLEQLKQRRNVADALHSENQELRNEIKKLSDQIAALNTEFLRFKKEE